MIIFVLKNMDSFVSMIIPQKTTYMQSELMMCMIFGIEYMNKHIDKQESIIDVKKLFESWKNK